MTICSPPRGVQLTAVLERAGLSHRPTRSCSRHRQRYGNGREDITRFERSLAVDQLRATGALLAFAMNGEALPVQHGYPLRLIVRGWYAVASVKWLTGIEAIDEPFTGYYQLDKYQYERDRDGQAAREPVTLQQVRSLIVEPRSDHAADRGETLIRGVA